MKPSVGLNCGRTRGPCSTALSLPLPDTNGEAAMTAAMIAVRSRHRRASEPNELNETDRPGGRSADTRMPSSPPEDPRPPGTTARRPPGGRQRGGAAEAAAETAATSAAEAKAEAPATSAADAATDAPMAHAAEAAAKAPAARAAEAAAAPTADEAAAEAPAASATEAAAEAPAASAAEAAAEAPAASAAEAAAGAPAASAAEAATEAPAASAAEAAAEAPAASAAEAAAGAPAASAAEAGSAPPGGGAQGQKRTRGDAGTTIGDASALEQETEFEICSQNTPALSPTVAVCTSPRPPTPRAPVTGEAEAAAEAPAASAAEAATEAPAASAAEAAAEAPAASAAEAAAGAPAASAAEAGSAPPGGGAQGQKRTRGDAGTTIGDASALEQETEFEICSQNTPALSPTVAVCTSPRPPTPRAPPSVPSRAATDPGEGGRPEATGGRETGATSAPPPRFTWGRGGDTEAPTTTAPAAGAADVAPTAEAAEARQRPEGDAPAEGAREEVGEGVEGLERRNTRRRTRRRALDLDWAEGEA